MILIGLGLLVDEEHTTLHFIIMANQCDVLEEIRKEIILLIKKCVLRHLVAGDGLKLIILPKECGEQLLVKQSLFHGRLSKHGKLRNTVRQHRQVHFFG